MASQKRYIIVFFLLLSVFFSSLLRADTFDNLFEKHAVVMLLIEPESGKIFRANQAASEYYGYSKNKLQQMHIQEINALSPEAVAAERELARKENRNYFIFRHKLADGSIRTVEVSAIPFEQDQQNYLFSIVTDINDLRAAEDSLWHYQNQLEEMVKQQLSYLRSKDLFIYTLLAIALVSLLFATAAMAYMLYRKRLHASQLQAEKTRLDDIIWGTNAGTWEWDCLSEKIAINHRWADIAGFTMAELEPLTLSKLESMIHQDDLETMRLQLNDHLTGKEDYYQSEYRIRHQQGHWVWVLDRGRMVKQDEAGNPVRICGTLQDISSEKRALLQLEHMAHYDQLTHLANRSLFYERLNHALVSAKRSPDCFAVMFLDLDGFKEVNDQYGHHIGDALLIEVAKRLQAAVRESDTCARMGGDEFALLIDHLSDHHAAALVAEHILTQLHSPYELEGHRLTNLSCSLGIALYPDHESSGNSLVQMADSAMYEAKRSGKDTFVFASNKTDRFERRAIKKDS
ncbi:sensor domain-containing diguanylate cyclase [Oceanospirillum linum]|uniref:Diguanylate cyclase n=1 Tax=Oceanospirillum linum TaxID=966 RepID=A0A1T1H911_OCELI|nr:sensor domain-containing diguanylate cyclase [Oceanospirillum linum]OOV86266.1 hypothetical protein BTA35_0213675 [Oceanospirillum linum]SEG52685.1 PAS domain S-box-containing protein/diguanylate cyclase (GGDEF) domain-containing protein [Oleiphilus messinensis]SMP30474.1 PAS domain S-box-containing protein/diguanylate cyclase (GGDEF) domain-containing protein [Oceanospirillum linum]